MESDWTTVVMYEGYTRKAHEINDVVFNWEVIAWREDRPDLPYLKARGTTFDGAVNHSTITINREITKLGS